MKLYEAVHLVRSKKFKYFYASECVLYGIDEADSSYYIEGSSNKKHPVSMYDLRSAIKNDIADIWNVAPEGTKPRRY